MIANLIGQLTSEIGISDTQANTAVGGILNLLNDNTDDGESSVSSLIGGLPGADGLMASAASAVSDGGSTGGMLGGLASKFLGGSALGDSLGGLAGVTSLLSATDLNAGQLGDVASRLFAFAKENVGEEIVEKVLSAVPAEIRSLVA